MTMSATLITPREQRKGVGALGAHTSLPHFTRISDLSRQELHDLLGLAKAMKAAPGQWEGVLRGHSVACIFEKPSTRTRVSFAAAIARLGATPIALSPQELQLGRGESIADTARSLSGYVSAIVIRTFAQDTVDELARWATVPVVNALSDEHHPCQALADVLTIEERFGSSAGRRLAFVGDGGDNVAHSLLEIAALTGLDITIGCPPDYTPDQAVLADAERLARASGAALKVVHHPAAAVRGADAVYEDVWASMGEESDASNAPPPCAPSRSPSSSWDRPTLTRSSSTACPRSEARRLRPPSSTGRNRSFGSSRPTGCPPKRRFCSRSLPASRARSGDDENRRRSRRKRAIAPRRAGGSGNPEDTRPRGRSRPRRTCSPRRADNHAR